MKKWTENIARRATHTRLKKIDALLVEIANLWGDEDEYIVARAELVRSLAREIKDEIDEAIEARAIERAMA